MDRIEQIGDRSWPLPERPCRLRQRWSRLLFAHWPMQANVLQQRLPAGLRVDTLDGWAWLGVVPFLMDRVRLRIAGERALHVPTAHAFPELNLRTYVIAPDGRPGVYFFSLDAASLLAVVGARIGFGLPYFWARMQVEQSGEITRYRSHRRIGPPADFAARYRPLGSAAARDGLSHFLTDRYAFFTRFLGSVQAGEIHHAPWNLQNAEAEFERNDLPSAFGFSLPARPPVLHYAAELHMQAWTLRRVHAA